MKSVLLGMCLMVVVSLVAWAVMETQATTSGEAFVSQNNSVRIEQSDMVRPEKAPEERE